jgi:hypothetical protein
MDGLSPSWVIGFPICSVIFAIVAFPIAKLALRDMQEKQRMLAAVLAALSIALLIFYLIFILRFFGFYAGPLAFIPLGVLFLSSIYFIYRVMKPGDFRSYRLPRVYKVFASIVALIFLTISVLSLFPPSDRKFVSPDGKYEVYVYTGSKCGKTQFKLYSNSGLFLSKGEIDSNCTPNRSGGAIWHKDHVALDYMCANGDCYPLYMRFDGRNLSLDDGVRFQQIYRGDVK